MRYHIENMSCGGCVRSITRVVQSVDAGAKVAADLDSRTVEIETQAPGEKVEAALSQAGYPARAA